MHDTVPNYMKHDVPTTLCLGSHIYWIKKKYVGLAFELIKLSIIDFQLLIF